MFNQSGQQVSVQMNQSTCQWGCVQDLNAQAVHGTDIWAPSDGHTQRGFELTDFRDSYGQACSVQESSNIEPHLWVGVDCCRMHLTPAQSRGLALRLLAFANTYEDREEID